jgi:hypothetical protein
MRFGVGARWYCALGLAVGRQDAGRAEALTRLGRDPGNVSLALPWALDNDIAAALPFADSLFYTWVGSRPCRRAQALVRARARGSGRALIQ